jgi:hypothetical protein
LQVFKGRIVRQEREKHAQRRKSAVRRAETPEGAADEPSASLRREANAAQEAYATSDEHEDIRKGSPLLILPIMAHQRDAYALHISTDSQTVRKVRKACC